MRSWCRLASKKDQCHSCRISFDDVTVAGFPFGAGASKGISSFASAWQEHSQSHSLTGMFEQSGASVLILIVAWRILERHLWILLTRSRCPCLGMAVNMAFSPQNCVANKQLRNCLFTTWFSGKKAMLTKKGPGFDSRHFSLASHGSAGF